MIAPEYFYSVEYLQRVIARVDILKDDLSILEEHPDYFSDDEIREKKEEIEMQRNYALEIINKRVIGKRIRRPDII